MTIQARIEPAALDALLAPYDTTNAPGFAVGVALKGRRGVFGSPIGGEGGIVSTVNDMLLWLKHMSAPVVGREATWAA